MAGRRGADIFLNRLNWKVDMGEITSFTVFQVDVFRFRFKSGMDGDTVKGFMHYVKRLRMEELRTVMKIFVWLYQHGVDFKLSFGWNPQLPAEYNIKNLFAPMRVRKKLLACGHDDLMSCPVEEMDKEE